MKKMRMFKSHCYVQWGVVMFAIAGIGSGAPLLAQTADIQLVALSSPSATDTTTTLPISESFFVNDATFVVEVWAQTTDLNGLSSVSADITFTTALANVSAVTPSTTFNVLTHGTIDNVTGIIDDLSGSHLGPCADAVGVTPNWSRVATLNVNALANGSLTFQSGASGSAIYGTAVCGLGNLPDAQIVFGSVTTTLVDCLTNSDCDDGQFCNGPETCDLVTHTCLSGTSPSCDDQIDCTDDICDPLANAGAGACVNTPINTLCNDLVNCTIDACDQLAAPGSGCSNVPDDTLCDNNLYCDGVETCNTIQDCQLGTAPCIETCEHCVEDSDTCDWCIFDLDVSGVMGTGDFSLFVPCFGACYLAGDPCLESNFDQDAGGCVGTADFSAFVGCFGDACGACAGCAGPGAVASTAAASTNNPYVTDIIRVRVIPRRSASLSDIAKTAPFSHSSFKIGDNIYVEIWTQLDTGDITSAIGLSSSYVDLRFDHRRMAAIDVIPSTVFSLFTKEFTASTDHVWRNIGGCVSPSIADTGNDGKWMRIATVVAQASSIGELSIFAGPSDDLHGFSRVGMFHNIDSSIIEFEGTTIQIGKNIRTLNRH